MMYMYHCRIYMRSTRKWAKINASVYDSNKCLSNNAVKVTSLRQRASHDIPEIEYLVVL